MQVCGEARNGEEAIRVAQKTNPDVVLLDLASDLAAATELIRFIVGLNPPVHVLGLHTASDSQAILQSLSYETTRSIFGNAVNLYILVYTLVGPGTAIAVLLAVIGYHRVQKQLGLSLVTKV